MASVTYGQTSQPVQAQATYQPAQATYQPAPTYGQQQTTVVVQQQYIGDGGVSRAVALFIIGWFIFPVWWFACCAICQPNQAPLAKVLNIVSTVLGIVWLVWVPIVLGIWIAAIIAAANIPFPNGTFYHHYY